MRARKLLLAHFFLLFSLPSIAIEHLFEGDKVTPIGTISIADQPAGLAWVPSKWNFSATASALSKTYYEVQDSSFQNQDSPLAIKPLYVATGHGQPWGGWVLHLENVDVDFRSQASANTGGTSTDADVRAKVSRLNATLAAGLRISEHWSLGWGTRLIQTQAEAMVISTSTIGADKTLSVQQGSYQGLNYALSMGAIMEYPNLRLGLTLSSPQQLISEGGENSTQQLTTIGDEYTQNKVNYLLDRNQDWLINAGMRIGRAGSAVFFSDSYSTAGSHKPTIGWEYRGEWALWALSSSYQNFKGRTDLAFTAGLVSKSENFDWGFGPSYQVIYDNSPGAINSRNINLLYATEIRY
ncbi:MAG: hypothetical protein ACK5P7_03515 [Bdellovibrio sp.]|jgi:hypothetical protein